MKRRTILFFSLLVVFLLTSCMDEEQCLDETNPNAKVYLSEIRESVNLYDFSDFGLYSISLKQEVVQNNTWENAHYYLNVEDNVFELKQNPLKKEVLEAFIPSSISFKRIESGYITVEIKKKALIERNDNDLTIKSVYIERKDSIYDKYGTDLYELRLTDYLSLKNIDNPFIFKDGNLIRPTHVKSNEKNAYTLQRFLNARQVSDNYNVNAAFVFLKNTSSHENLLSFENPNRVSISSSVQISEPDRRDRLRQLGTMGDLALNASFDIVDIALESQKIVQIKRENLPASYSNTYFYELAVDPATLCEFNTSATPGILTAIISYANTQSTEIIKNGRINCFYYDGPEINNALAENLDFYETNSLMLTWDATPGEISSGINQREKVEIKEYRIYLATSTEDYPEPATITDKAFSPQDLKWGETYKWKVVSVQNNDKVATSTEKQFDITDIIRVYNASGEYQNGYDSIHEAVAANPENGNVVKIYGDLILTDQIEISAKELKIVSSSDSESRTLDRQNNGRGFVITSDSSITFKNLTIKNCEMDDISGSAISSTESTVTLLNCTLDSNKVNKNTTSLVFGGGIYANDSFIRIENSTITDNYAYYAGGSICVNESSELIMKDSSVIGNESFIGSGGIYVTHSSSSTVVDTLFENNEISSLNISSNSTGTANRCTFTRGSKDKYANAIFVNINCDLTLTHSTITNYEKVFYGAVTLNWNPHGDDYCKAIIYGNLFRDCNSINKEAAAIYAFSDTTIYNSNGEKWRVANSPNQSVEYVENTTVDLNRYENVTFKGDANAVGAKVFFVDAP